MKICIFFLLFFLAEHHALFAQASVFDRYPGCDSVSYIQGFINAKYNNEYQVSARMSSTIETCRGGYDHYIREYCTFVMPQGPKFLLFFAGYSAYPININSPDEFNKSLCLEKVFIGDTVIKLNSKERAVLYLALRYVPINEIFVTKQEYDKSLFFQKLSVHYSDDKTVTSAKSKDGEEDIVVNFHQNTHYIYNVRFDKYKLRILSDSKKYIVRKLKKGEGFINEL